MPAHISGVADIVHHVDRDGLYYFPTTTALSHEAQVEAKAEDRHALHVLARLFVCPSSPHLTKPKMCLRREFNKRNSTCIVSIIRILTLKTAVSANDPTWDNVGPNSWSIVELNCAILCSNFPTLRPLVLRYFPTMDVISSGQENPSSAYKRYGRYGSKPAISKSSITHRGSRFDMSRVGDEESGRVDSMDHVKSTVRCFSAKGDHPDGFEVTGNNDSSGRIVVTTEMEVVSDQAPTWRPRSQQSFSWGDTETEGGNEIRRI